MRSTWSKQGCYIILMYPVFVMYLYTASLISVANYLGVIYFSSFSFYFFLFLIVIYVTEYRKFGVLKVQVFRMFLDALGRAQMMRSTWSKQGC